MERTEIEQTLEEIDGLRRTTRQTLQTFWFPLVVFGALTLASTPFYRIGDGSAVGIFWMLAGPAGGIATGVHYGRREATVGLGRPAAAYIVVAVAMMATAFLLPVVTSGHLAEVISHFAVAAGYLGFAWIERDGRLAAIAAFMVAVPLVLLAVAPGVAGVATAAINGCVLLAMGVVFRRTQATVPPRP